MGTDNPIQETPAMRWGNTLEPVIVQAYAQETGNSVEPGGLAIHKSKDAPWRMATLDGVATLPDGRLKILEVKTARTADHWGIPGTGEIPLQYACQVQHYMEVTGIHSADIAVLIGGSDFRIYHLVYNPKAWGQCMAVLDAFWHNHVVPKVPPPCTNLYHWDMNRDLGNTLTADDALSEQIRALAHARAHLNEWEKQERALSHALKMRLVETGAETILNENGDTMARWTKRAGRQTFDQAGLAKVHPEIYEKFLTQSKSYRVLTLKGVKNTDD
jgi:putative phage-type endonuclease